MCRLTTCDTATSCTTVCAAKTMNVRDLTSVIIQTLLNLANPTGSTVTQVYNYIVANLPEVTTTETDVSNALVHGCKRGVFFKRFLAPTDEPTFLVIANMNRFNPLNVAYYRPPCQPNGFWSATISS